MALTRYLKSFSYFTVGTVLVQLAILLRDMLVAKQLGLSAELDAWTLIWAGASFIIATFSGGTTGFLVPLLQNYFLQNQYPKSQILKFRNLVLKRVFILSVPLVLFQILSLQKLVGLEKYLLILIGFVLIILSIILSFKKTLLQALQKIETISFSPLISILSSLIIFKIFSAQIAVAALALGLLLGLFLEFVFLRLKLKSAVQTLSPSPHDLSGFSVFWNLVYGGALTAAGALLDQLMISTLFSQGNATLSYGGKISSAVVNFMGGVLAVIIFPQLAHEYAELKKITKLRPLLLQVSAVSILIAVLLFFIGGPLIHWLLLGGQFSSANADAVTQIHQVLVWQIPFYLVGNLGLQFLQIRSMGSLILKIAASGLALKIGLNYFLGTQWGVAGFAFSTVAFYACTSGLIWFNVGKQKQYWAEQS